MSHVELLEKHLQFVKDHYPDSHDTREAILALKRRLREALAAELVKA